MRPDLNRFPDVLERVVVLLQVKVDLCEAEEGFMRLLVVLDETTEEYSTPVRFLVTQDVRMETLAAN